MDNIMYQVACPTHNLVLPQSQLVLDNTVAFAHYAHTNRSKSGAPQFRKITGEPYIVHPIAVAQKLLSVGHRRPTLIQAAILHDVIEDTEITYANIAAVFSRAVAALVLAISNPSVHMKASPRALRRRVDLQYLTGCAYDPLLIKLADIGDNISDVESFEHGFAVQYLKEQRAIVDAVRPLMGDSSVWRDTNAYLHAKTLQIAGYTGESTEELFGAADSFDGTEEPLQMSAVPFKNR